MTALVVLLLVTIAACIYLFIKNRTYIKHIKFSRKVISAIPISMALLDKNKYIIDIINMTPKTMHGYKKADIIGKHLSVFTNNKLSPFYQACSMLDASFDRVNTSKQSETFRYMIGSAHLEANIQFLEGGYILSIVSDISKTTKAIQGMIQKKQNEIAVALNAGGLTSWSYNVETKLFDSVIDNEIIYNSTYYEDLIQKIDTDDRHTVQEAFHKLLHGESNHCEFTVKAMNRFGNLIWTNVHAVPDEHDEQGHVKTIIGSQKNITKEVESVNELIRLREQAEESNRLKSAFISNMSHEIRTPLNAIVGFSGLIASTEDKTEIEEYSKIIEQNNNLLLNIINDILDLSKIEANKMSYTFEDINVRELLKRLTMTTTLKIKNGVEIILDDVDQNIKLHSDTNRVSQVLVNFLNNAVKFTCKGSIHLGCQQHADGEICLYVQDTGIGIAEENKIKIFDRFVKLNDFAQGTGLGLSICETIATHLGGHIGMESELNKGSRFWIKIPSNYKTTANL